MKLALGLLLALAAVAAAPASSGADVVWLCKPGVEPDPCRESQATTVAAQDGSSRVENPANPANPPVDCFYVYPTVSGQPATNADKSKDPEQIAIARYQAARYSQTCRVYAPVYRQLTLASIFTGSVEARAAGRKIAYGDVREAWLEYLAKENRGRGVVLIGHSQGTGMLRQLIRQEVDPKPEVRKRVISALLMGGNVLVRKGQTAGGDFQSLPACTGPDQIGCVVAYSIFGDPPPGNTRFGASPPSDITGAGLPAGPDYEVLCTNPVSLGANERRPATTLLRSEPFPGGIGAGLIVMYGGPPPTAPTPWLQPSERYSVRCERSNGANVLMAQPLDGARHLNPSPTPDWGLHLADANLPLGDLVALVARQSAAYLKATATPRLRIRALCGKRGVRFVLGGKDRPLVKRSKATRSGKRVRILATLRDGRSVTLTMRVPRCRRSS
jgi:Protein of unknown function (DUF3089)